MLHRRELLGLLIAAPFVRGTGLLGQAPLWRPSVHVLGEIMKMNGRFYVCIGSGSASAAMFQELIGPSFSDVSYETAMRWGVRVNNE
jgi:hypothetical protein